LSLIIIDNQAFFTTSLPTSPSLPMIHRTKKMTGSSIFRTMLDKLEDHFDTTSRVPSTQSPERSVSRSHISQQRHPLCLAQNQHAPAVHSGQIAVNRPPHCSHHLFSAPSVSRVLVRKSSRLKSAGMGFGPASGISAGAPRPLRRDHPISTDSIVAAHNSPFLPSIRAVSRASSGAPHLPGEDLHLGCPHISEIVPMTSTV
jgi:hypothetical protein